MTSKDTLTGVGSSFRLLVQRNSATAITTSSSTSPQVDKQLDFMLNGLSPEELEIAARASYEYLKNPQPSTREHHARQLALKYLNSKKDEMIALAKLKSTLQFRKEMDMDGLRLAFDDPNSKYHDPLKEQLSSETLKVQGYDKDGRATYIFVPRHVQNHDNVEWVLKQHIYTLERALACSRQRTVNAIVDFTGFSARHAPPTHVGREFMSTFRNHYSGAIHQIFLVDAPFCFLALWSIFKPLLAPQTRRKIHFVQSSKRHNPLEQSYHPDQASSWMMPSGTKNREFNLQEYLYETPFHQAFDE